MAETEIQPERKAQVYVIEQQAFDYLPATTYGDLVFMEVKRLAPYAPSMPDAWNKDALRLVRRDLASYVPGYDYIIPTGAPARMVVVGAVLREKGPRHRVLGWDARTQRYLEYVVDFG